MSYTVTVRSELCGAVRTDTTCQQVEGEVAGAEPEARASFSASSANPHIRNRCPVFRVALASLPGSLRQACTAHALNLPRTCKPARNGAEAGAARYVRHVRHAATPILNHPRLRMSRTRSHQHRSHILVKLRTLRRVYGACSSEALGCLYPALTFRAPFS